MAKTLCKKRVVEYTKEYKEKVVELTDKFDVKAIDISDVLGLHPIVVYLWRQEYREGKLVFEPSVELVEQHPKK
jgi:transposase